MKLLTIVGARPQFVKAAAVSRVLRSVPGIREVLVHTGQHYDGNMSDAFFDELEIPRANHRLEIGSGAHGAQTGRMLEAIERVLVAEQPDWVLVYGDTNSTLAGTLAAVKLHIPVAHVEAGLRSFNRRMPEEINRVLTDHSSNILFAPTGTAVENLRREGISTEKVHEVGDVMYDLVLHYGARAERESSVLTRMSLAPGEYVLATIHRAENTDDPARLRAVFEGLSRIAESLPVILPLHPRTSAALRREGLWEQAACAVRFTDPAGYLDMLMLEKNAALIATDSGGVQKEAFFCRVPCLTLRDETEWVELVDTGWNRLVPPRTGTEIADAASELLNRPAPPAEAGALYGDGHAAERIIRVLETAS